MKYSRTAVIRALATILIGALLIVFPLEADRWLVMGIGALFLVPGVVTVVTWMARKKSEKGVAPAPESVAPASANSESDNQSNPADSATSNSGTRSEQSAMNTAKASSRIFFPIIGVGSILFGAILLIYPDEFRAVLLYILGAFLVMAGIAQLIHLNKMSRQYRLGATPFVVSTLITLAGVGIILIKWFGSKDVAPLPDGSMPTIALLPSYIFGVAGIIYGLSEIIYSIQFRHYDDKPRQTANAQSGGRAQGLAPTAQPDNSEYSENSENSDNSNNSDSSNSSNPSDSSNP